MSRDIDKNPTLVDFKKTNVESEEVCLLSEPSSAYDAADNVNGNEGAIDIDIDQNGGYALPRHKLRCAVFFALGCLICMAHSMTFVVIGRFIAGIGGSGLTTLTTIILSDLIPLRDRGVYQGYTNSFYGLGVATGGIFGGVINDYFGWRYAFGLQVPLACILGVSLYFNLQFPKGSPGLGSPGHFKEKLAKVDFLGSTLLVSGLLVLLTAASIGGKEVAYSSKPFIGLCLASVFLFGTFVWAESHTPLQPIIPISLLRRRTILASSMTNWFYTMGVFTYLFYVPIYYISVMDYNTTKIGMRLIPNFFGTSLGSVGAGIYMKRTGRYYNLIIVIGVLAIVGNLNILSINPTISNLRQFTLLLPCGLAYSGILTATLMSLIAAVPASHQAGTTSISYTFRATGSTLGVSISSAIFQYSLRSMLNSKIPSIVNDQVMSDYIIKHALQSTSYASKAPEYVQVALRCCYEYAVKKTLLFSFICVVIGVFASLFIQEHELHTSINRNK
ncbi:hypothetical protein PSN45_003070 [Yamadazyma tenuis]|uniref:uncharacterized protein n=1 Tax=Candida tenuis TaxID=2315449 RepID=UPI00279B6179|nr:hypothetical protein PSN45_003070 [Yamadazyma tenuis]